MIPRTNNLRLWPRFPFKSTLSRRPLLAACAMALSLVACANRKSAEGTPSPRTIKSCPLPPPGAKPACNRS